MRETICDDVESSSVRYDVDWERGMERAAIHIPAPLEGACSSGRMLARYFMAQIELPICLRNRREVASDSVHMILQAPSDLQPTLQASPSLDAPVPDSRYPDT